MPDVERKKQHGNKENQRLRIRNTRGSGQVPEQQRFNEHDYGGNQAVPEVHVPVTAYRTGKIESMRFHCLYNCDLCRAVGWPSAKKKRGMSRPLQEGNDRCSAQRCD